MTDRILMPMPTVDGRPWDGTLLDVTRPEWTGYRQRAARAARAVTMAYDAALPRGARDHGNYVAGARDEGGTPETELLHFLEGKLSENDYVEAEKMIEALADAEPVDRSDRTPGNGRPAGIRAADEDTETPAEMRERHAAELAGADKGARDRRRQANDAALAHDRFARLHRETARNIARLRIL